MAKCRRIRTDGPTPCLCCDGECFGDVCTYPGCDCAFEWGSVMPMPRTVCLKAPPLTVGMAESYAKAAAIIERRAARPHRLRVTWRGLLVWGLAMGALAIGAALLPPNGYRAHHPERDIRCDTPARYEAMREGADCS